MPKKSGKAAKAAINLTSQLEDYLEAIAVLQEEDRVARAKDIAERLGVTRATVTSALKSLSEKGLINYQPYSHITLTSAGEARSSEIIRRHEVLTDFFQSVLQLPPEKADDNACRAEHVLDPEVIERMLCFADFMKTCPRTNEIWQKAYMQSCREKSGPGDCARCLEECLDEVKTAR
jgi:DtxR family Mn-dependent transcriptional regulator